MKEILQRGVRTAIKKSTSLLDLKFYIQILDSIFEEDAIYNNPSEMNINQNNKADKKSIDFDLNQVFGNINELIFSIRIPDLTTIFISNACEQIFGYTKEEFEQNASLWIESIHESDRPAITQSIIDIIDTNSKTLEYRIITKSGNSKWLRTTVNGKFDENGKLKMIIGISTDVSDIKATENSLIQSQDQYRHLFDTMEDGYYKSTHDGKFIDVNAALVKMLGYSNAEELKNIDIKTQLYFETSEREEANNSYDLDGVSTFRLKRKDGKEIWVEDKGTYIKDDQGNILYHEGFLRDATQRVENARALKSSLQETENYKKALDQSLMFCITDKDGVILYVNDNFCRVCKYSPDELIGKTHRLINSGYHSTDFIRSMWKTISSGSCWSGEFKNKDKNGTEYWIDASIVPILNEHGEAIQYLSVSSNITDKKKFEIVISENEKKYRNIIQSSNDLIQSVDLNGKFEFVNNSWLQTLGYTLDEIKDLNLFDIVDESDHDLCSALFRDISNGIKLDRITTILKTKQGSKIIVEGNTVPIIIDNKVCGAQTFFRDITDRIAAEESLIIRMDELKKSNLELDKFVYSVSHDLRAPLSSMLGIIALAKDDCECGQMQEHLLMMQNSINKLDGFICDILDYSRNARTEIKKSEVDMNDLIHEITQNLKYMGGVNRPIDIRIEINGEKTIYTDRSRMNIVLNNLISNAIRYQNEKNPDPFVDIRVDMSDTETGIIIRDNGIGIPFDLQPKIFDMFFRVSDNSVGTGLGLYIVKEAIGKLNGNIEVESQPGVGSSFKITLPII